MNVHAKTALTEPARIRRWQLSEAGTRKATTVDALSVNGRCESTITGTSRSDTVPPNLTDLGIFEEKEETRRPSRVTGCLGRSNYIKKVGHTARLCH